MQTETKNTIDVVLTGLTMLGGLIAFLYGFAQWRRDQEWKRADKLDAFITKFETDELLRLAAVVLDWRKRTTAFRNRELTVENDDALLALRSHRTIETKPMFPGEQATLRDAYDAILTFFQRLEIAINTGLIEVIPAKLYFSYWLERLITFDRHPDVKKVLNGMTPQAMVAAYIQLYGDPGAIKRLCERFQVSEHIENVRIRRQRNAMKHQFATRL